MNQPKFSRISPVELHQLAASGAKPIIVDVRTPEEYRKAHVPGAQLMPLDQLDPTKFTVPDHPLYVICQSGHRSIMACRALAQAGLAAVNVDGGTMAWAQAGLPIEQEPGSLRITR